MLDFAGFTQLLITGALAGLTAGFFGVGGGIILTPLCLIVYPSLGVDGIDLIKIIFGTNMFLVTVFSVSAVIMHSNKGNVLWRTVLVLSPFAVLGSLGGSWMASHSDPSNLKKAFAILLLVSAALTLRKNTDSPNNPGIQKQQLLSGSYLPVLGFLAGFLGSFLGVGGGIIMVTPMILLFGLPIKKVAGTSSAVIISIGIAAAAGYILYGPELNLPGASTGYVWWSAALPLVIGGVPGARFGAWLNSRTKSRVLGILFGIIMFVIGLKILLF